MKNINHIEAGALQIPTIQIPIVDVPYNENGITVWQPTPTDLESGVVAVLQEHATVKHVGGTHRFLVHTSPPRTHHPDASRHAVYWIDRQGKGKTVVPWTDESWQLLAQDRDFLAHSDAWFSQMQSENPDLRIFHAFGFAKQHDRDKIAGRKIDPRSIQSQYRGHIHLVDAVDAQVFPSTWLQEKQILSSTWLLPFFLNTSGELAIQHYSTQLKSFGTKVMYSQTIGKTSKFDIQRTMFAFSSWQEALNSVVELYSQLYEGWLNTAALVAENKVEFSGVMIDILQASVPGFMLIKPSLQDKKAGGISTESNWLVMPFDLPLPQVTLQPGVLFNRVKPKE